MLHGDDALADKLADWSSRAASCGIARKHARVKL